MKKLDLALSNRIKKSRYVSLPKQPKVDSVFYAGFEICQADFSIDRENFPFWTLEYVTDGQGEINLGGKSKPLSTGSVLCYGPGMRIHFHNDPQHPFHKYFLCRTDKQFPASWHQAGLNPGTLVELTGGVPFAEVLEQLLHDGENGTSGSGPILNAVELILLSYVRSGNQASELASTGAAKVYQLTMQVMHKEFREIKSLDELSKRTGYGPEYLCRIFRKHHIESPYQAMQRMKMNEAFRLLKEGRLRIMDVAQQVGFDDPLHFSRVFRKTMGFPPSVVNDR